MPLTEPTAPWTQPEASSNSGTATAEVETKAQPSTSDATPAIDRKSDPDYKAFMRTQKPEKPDADQPAKTLDNPKLDSEVKEQDTKPANDEPAKIEFTPKAEKYAKDLGVTQDDALDVALKAFERVGVFTDDEILERFKSNDKAFIEQGLKLAKQQKDTDRAFNAFQRGNTTDEQQKPQGQVEATEKALPIPEAVKQVIDQAFEPLKNDEILKDMIDPLGIAFTTVAEQIGKHYSHELNQAREQALQQQGQFESQIQNLNGAINDMKIERERTSLVERYPTLKDNAIQDRVLKMYDTLVESGEFKSVEDAYRKAVSAELGEETTLSLKKRLLTEHQTRKNGQPRVPNSGPSDDRKPTAEEQDRMAFARAMKQNNRKF